MKRILTVLITILICISNFSFFRAEETDFEIVNNTIDYKANEGSAKIQVKLNIDEDCIKNIYINDELLESGFYYISDGNFYLSEPNQCKDRVIQNIVSRENTLTFEYRDNEEIKTNTFSFFVDNYDFCPDLITTYGTDPIESEIKKVDLKDITISLNTSLENFHFEFGCKTEENNGAEKILATNSDNSDVITFDNDKGIIIIPKEYLETLEVGTYYFSGAWFGYKFTKEFVIEHGNVDISSLKLNEEQLNLHVGQSFELYAEVLSGNAENYAIEWNSSDTNIVTVNENGLLTAVSQGTAVITAIVLGEDNLNASCNVTVVKNTLDTSNATAYAVLSPDGHLIFLKSNNSYLNNSTATVTDINGYDYTGIVYADIENILAVSEEDIPWYGDRENINKAYVADNNIIQPTSLGYWFYGCDNLEDFDSTGFNTSNVTDMGDMFYSCSSLTSLDLSHFDTSNVEYMWDMFSDCGSLTSLDLSSFNTSNVVDMTYMFYGCDSLTSLDLSSFNTGNVNYMQDMFENCSSLTSINLNSFDVRNVTNMGYMFTGCSSLTSLDLSSFSTSNVTVMDSMFDGCNVLTSLDLSNFDTNKVTSMDYLFYECTSLAEVKLGTGFTTWQNESYLPTGNWTNGEFIKTETELQEEYPLHASEWAGTWVRITHYVSSVELNRTVLELNKGQTETLTATVLPENATVKKLNWSSSDESIATVDENGVVTGVSEGTATITVTTTDGTGLSDSCTVTVVEETTSPVVIQSSALVLEGVIQIQFKVIVPEAEEKNILVKFEGGNASNSYEESYNAAEKRVKSEETAEGMVYYYRVPVYAKQMNDKVTIWFTDLEGNKVSFYRASGTDVTESGFEYSVATYINNKWDSSTTKTRNLVRAMKYYGLYAQKAFTYEVSLADEILSTLEPMSDVDISLLEPYVYVKEGTAPAGLKVASFSLTLEEDIRINYKLDVGEGVNPEDYDIRLDGKKVKAEKSGSEWYVYKANIAAKDLDTMHELSISDGTNTMVYRYGVLTYCYNKLSNSNTDANTKNLCKSIYWYSKAADAYWGN